ncbi:MAG: CaiB/BaiF CoA-transferase family protein [Alphaproteobacteria bacterium]
MTAAAGWNPLQGIRVLDFSTFLPGPFATQVLGDLGADVIKVEPLAGDPGRLTLPPDAFALVNRNRRSIALDLKNPAVKPAIGRLARWADVAIEGFRPGVTDRLGVGYDELRRHNPRLIYCSLSGYGQDGPLRDVPGHDLNFIAGSGALSFAGHFIEKPRRSGLPVADCAGGFLAITAILAALLKRNATGEGAYLDATLFEAALLMTATRGTSVDPEQREHLHATNELFETKDGRQIALGMVEEHFWRAFCEVASTVDPAVRDPRFGNLDGRHHHGRELVALLTRILRQRTAQEWIDAFGGRIPLQLAFTPQEALDQPQVAARKIVMEENGHRHILFPVHVDGQTAGAFRRKAPACGEHTREVLAEIGLGAAEIDGIIASGAAKGAR